MNEGHKHIWAPSGCWCGARRCQKDIPRTDPPYKWPKKAKPFIRCENAAGPTGLCPEHGAGDRA